MASSSSRQPPPFILALAGPTSSGKTTIATALSLIFSSSPSSTNNSPNQTTNPLTIIHADDFYLPDSKIPTLPTGTQDWDCPEALDVDRLHSVLTTVLEGGDVPGNLVRQGGLEDVDRNGGAVSEAKGEEAMNRVKGTPSSSSSKEKELETNLDSGIHGVKIKQSPPPPPPPAISSTTISALQTHALTFPPRSKLRPIILLEGIFLFSPSPSPLSILTPLYTTKILLRSTRAAAKRRREARNGYVTLEGFWRDPDGYFDRVVWPGFEKVYAGLFVGGDVEGVVDAGRVGEMGVLVGPVVGDDDDGDGDGVGQGRGGGLDGVLTWIMEVIEKEVAGRD